MRQLVDKKFISNIRPSFNVWWKKKLAKHQKVSKHYETVSRFILIDWFLYKCNTGIWWFRHLFKTITVTVKTYASVNRKDNCKSHCFSWVQSCWPVQKNQPVIDGINKLKIWNKALSLATYKISCYWKAKRLDEIAGLKMGASQRALSLTAVSKRCTIGKPYGRAALYEKCPNTEFFLVCNLPYPVRIFPYSVRILAIRTRKISVVGHFSRSAVCTADFPVKNSQEMFRCLCWYNSKANFFRSCLPVCFGGFFRIINVSTDVFVLFTLHWIMAEYFLVLA